MNKLNFVKKEKKSSESSNLKKWKVLIADDDIEVHNITKTVLQNFEYNGIGLEFISAFSGKETREVLDNSTDIAVILLDVVMETNDAGLQVVKYLRKDLLNKSIRIVLRTGQPGSAPERVVIEQYEIDDYKEKTELTAQKLYTTIRTSIRSYIQLVELQKKYEEHYKITLAGTVPGAS